MAGSLRRGLLAMKMRVFYGQSGGRDLQRIDFRPDKVDQGLRGDFQLETAKAGADVDVVVEEGAFVDEGGEGFLHADGGAAAADVAGGGQEFTDVEHLAVLVAGDLGGDLQVHFEIAGDHADEEAGAVAAQHEGLEHLFDILAQLVGDVLRGQVGFVHFVGDEFVGDAGCVEQPGRIGLGGCVILLGHRAGESLKR